MSIQDRLNATRKELLTIQRELIQQLSGEKSRARGPMNRNLHVVRGMLSPSYPYVSQAGQDAIVDRLLGQKSGGTFIDIGAYDGVTGSNSLFFERVRDWTGVMVEPVASQREKAEQARKSPCLPYAVSTKKGTAEMITVSEGYTQMSGLSQSYDAEMLEKVRANPRHVEEIVKVPTRSIAAILKEVDIPDPDFISLDIEGGELEALSKFPFKNHDVKVWAIENNTSDSALPALMRDNGYSLVEFCGPDEIYLKNQ